MDSEDIEQPVVSEPAGQQLRRAREQKGLSVSAVADAQHLRPAIIHAIEDGDYEQIDSELFLKGYVRTYARQVDLDPDAVIATLDKELEPLRQQRVQAEEANPLVDIERRRRQKRRVAKVLFFILVIAIVVFVGLRFLDNMGTATSPEEPGSEEAASEMSEPGEPNGSEPAEPDGNSESPDVSEVSPDREDDVSEADAGNGQLAPDESAPDEPAEAETTAVVPMEEDSGVSPATDNEIPLVTESDPGEQERAPPETAAPAFDEADESRVPAVTSSPEPTFEESAQPDAAAANARLEMSFTDECWVQVTDSAGNRLVGSLQRDGDSIDVSGRVPLEVIVGAVDAIGSIRFDGEPVDTSDFRVFNNRAEFTLDI